MNTKLIENMKKKKKKGFTLIELIIVIAILAILAALALPKFGAVRDTANKSADKATAKNIQTTISKLIADDKLTGITNVTDTAVDPASTNTDVQAIVKNIDGGLVGKTKGHEGKNFHYTINSDGNITITLDNLQVFPTPDAAFN